MLVVLFEYLDACSWIVPAVYLGKSLFKLDNHVNFMLPFWDIYTHLHHQMPWEFSLFVFVSHVLKLVVYHLHVLHRVDNDKTELSGFDKHVDLFVIFDVYKADVLASYIA